SQSSGLGGVSSTTKNQQAAIQPIQIAEQETKRASSSSGLRVEGGDHIIIFFFTPAEAKAWDKRAAVANTEIADINVTIDSFYTQPDTGFIPKYKKELFVLNDEGVLNLSPIGEISLLGLSQDEAAERLRVEPLLHAYDIRIKLLPIKRTGLAALKLFGYELFNSPQALQRLNGYDPSILPVPPNYIMGPGDILMVQLYGKENDEYQLQITREGMLTFPGIGPISVNGMTFKELKKALTNRIKKQFIGVSANITLSEMRAMQVYVLGEVRDPGLHTMNSLATVMDALVFSGGLKEIASLRRIELRRNNQLIKTIDLYELLLKGKMSTDLRLITGDVIYVPSVDASVKLLGEVRRPAIYEIKNKTSLEQIIDQAGGLTEEAAADKIQIERFGQNSKKQIIDVDLNNPKDKSLLLEKGDIIHVKTNIEHLLQAVDVQGEVHYPGRTQWHKDLRLLDVLPNYKVLKQNADPNYVLIKRVQQPNNLVTTFSVNLVKAFANPDSEQNRLLLPQDEIFVFDLSESRSLQIKPIIDLIDTQAKGDHYSKIVRVGGNIRAPGTYPLEPNMRISDLVRAGGNLKESAFTLEAELTRYGVGAGKVREIKHLKVDLAGILVDRETTKDLILEPYDMLTIKEIPLWKEQKLVEIRGEVKFPGKYPISRGETLSSLLDRAGGMTEFAYPQGAVFTREELRKREQQRLDEMSANLESELASISLERSGDPSAVQAAGAASKLLNNLTNTKAAGRLVINIVKAINNDKEFDLVLNGGDLLVIPKLMQEVTVIGEVFHPTSHIYNDGLSGKKYVSFSGGGTRKADMSRSYIIRADGAVEEMYKYWLLPVSTSIRPGDTIVVPLDAERVSSLNLWTNISQIVYQLGVAAAAWKTLGFFN
ncbi:MAG: SLBB domain-containing protein, partial [Gammaproteobacteria bacterium]|nr:SLBB domain-containing protein [Gammaproteobacteria bacterium]